MIYIPTILFYCAFVNHCGHLSPTKCLFLLIIDSFGDTTNKLQHILNTSDSESNNVDRLGHGKRKKISSSSVRSLFETAGVDADESSDDDSLAVGYTLYYCKYCYYLCK
jgi:hypothetical protein